MLVVYKEPKNGKIELTTKELEEYLEKAKQEGYSEGYAKGYSDGNQTPITYPPTSPTNPSYPNYPYYPYWLPQTWCSDVTALGKYPADILNPKATAKQAGV